MSRVYLKEPPDGGWGWLIVLGGMYCLALWGGAIRCYSVFFEPMMTEFDAEYGPVAWLNGMFQISYGIFTFVGPMAMKRIDCRWLCLGASIICGVSCFFASFCEELWAVQVFMGLIVGSCVGIVSISMFTTVTRYFKKRLHAANQFLCLGIAAGPLLLCPSYQYLNATYGWRGAAQIIAGLFLNMAVASALMRPIKLESDLESPGMEKYKDRKPSVSSAAKPKPKNVVNLVTMDAEIVGSQSIGLYTPPLRRKMLDANANVTDKKLTKSPEETPLNLSTESLEDDAHGGVGESMFSERFNAFCRRFHLNILADGRFYLYSFSWTLFACGYYSASTYIIPYGKKELGLSDFEASTLVSAIAGGSLFARVVYAMFFDKMPMRYRVLYVSALYATYSVAMFMMPFMPNYLGAMICCVCVGAFGGGTDGIYSAFIAEIFSVRQYAFVFGYSNVITHSTGTATTVLIGVIVDRVGNLLVPFYIGGASVIISSVLVFLLHKKVEKIRRERGTEEKSQSDIAE